MPPRRRSVGYPLLLLEKSEMKLSFKAKLFVTLVFRVFFLRERNLVLFSFPQYVCPLTARRGGCGLLKRAELPNATLSLSLYNEEGHV